MNSGDQHPTELHQQISVGAYLRGHRLRAGLSLEDVATASGFTIGYLSLIENGHRVPPVKTICRIADAIAEVGVRSA